MTDNDIAWGPSGEVVYNRTYSRPKPDGTKETWPETVSRVAEGNLALVYGPPSGWSGEVWDEYLELQRHMLDFKIIPAGRHLWATGVKGRQYLFNCWTAGWGVKLSDHFEFTFLRLMEGGGVGANYSSHYLKPYGVPLRRLNVHIVCDPEHPDYEELRPYLSQTFCPDWDGAFEVADSREGWAGALTDLIDTYMTREHVKHQDRVYDVSNVRGRGARLKTFGGTASGPAPFARMMLEVGRVLNEALVNDPTDDWLIPQVTPLQAMEIDHAIAECVVSGGNRRSARMAMVRWDDPYIFEFIRCKQDTSKHWTTNISVEVDEKFFAAMDRSFCVACEREGERSGVPLCDLHGFGPLANDVHKAVVEGMLANGEPGYFNSTLANKGEIRLIYTTNPCGEIALEPFEACNLGHVNLDAFVSGEGLHRAHELMTRFLIRATFADINDPRSREVQDRNRRIGVGHLGVQGWLNKSGIRYSEAPTDLLVQASLEGLRETVRNEARKYAFELRIPEPIKVTTVAPTGSIAKLPGVTEGIHPIYARYFEQRIRFSLRDPEQAAQVDEARAQGFEVETDEYDPSGWTAVVVYPTKNRLVEQVQALGFEAELVEQADEIPLDRMLAFQAMYQRCYADNAVSFTVNIDPDSECVGSLADELAVWLPHVKGTTIMPDNSRPQAPFTRITQEQYETWALAHGIDVLSDGVDEECVNGACPIR